MWIWSAQALAPCKRGAAHRDPGDYDLGIALGSCADSARCSAIAWDVIDGDAVLLIAARGACFWILPKPHKYNRNLGSGR